MKTRSGAAGFAVSCALVAGGGLDAWASSPAASAPSAGGQAVASASTRLEDYHLMALSPSEGIAVLRAPDRKLVTLRIGGTLAPAKARLAQVLGDRLRFDTVDDKGNRQTAWMIRAANPEQAPEVQRVSGNMPPAPTAGSGGSTVTPLKSQGAR